MSDLPPGATAAIDALVRAEAHARRVPWLVVGVVSGDRLTHTAIAGVAGEHEGLGPNTLFRIASMTKSFVAATALVLRDRGVLDLHAPLHEYLPGAETLYGPTADSPPLTVHTLLSMSAGLPSDDPWGDRQLAQTAEWLDAFISRGATFAHPPCTSFEYSNLSYAIVGRVIERVTGQRCTSVVDESLLRPLDLHHTVWTSGEAPRGTLVASPHDMIDDRPVPAAEPLGVGAFSPMGGLWSTAADLARWVDFLGSAFPARDDPDHAPLSRASRREMQQVHRVRHIEPVLRPDGSLRAIPLGYGLGVQLVQHEVLGTVAHHSGGLPGYGSHMRWVPGRGVGVVALGNRTYPGLVTVTDAALELLLEHGFVSRQGVEVSRYLRRSVDELVSLLNAWTDRRANQVFADNVSLDESLERRARAAAALQARYGQLRVDRIDAMSATEGDVSLVAADGRRLTLELMLSPEAPPRVQWYSVSERA
jgi:CubicO group peptidase (beta-lactamase class C family)